MIVTGTLLGNAVVFFGNELLHIYSSNPEVIAAGIVRLHYISMVYALCGIMDVMVGALRGIGYHADDCFHCGCVCAASGMAGDGVPDSGVSPYRNGLSVLSGHVDTDQSCLYRVLYLGTRPNMPEIGCCLSAFEKLLYAPKAYGRFFYFCIKFVL